MSVNLSNLQPEPRKLLKVSPEDQVVISGIAGRFPDSDNVYHLQENLMNKVNLISDDDRRWKTDDPRIPQHTGKINGLEKFDAVYFGIHSKQADCMDPMARILLEHTYEAIVDAGINPKHIRGKKIGVFIGVCFSESEKNWDHISKQFNNYVLSGISRAMFSNRISYAFGFTGPSQTVDTACSSSSTAFENAYRAICEGVCDAAVVGGSNLCLDPTLSIHFFNLGILTTDGRCKTFDEKANGYVRSESIGVVFLQKAKGAKRIYATVVHTKSNCDGFKEEGITFPSTHMQTLLLKEVYAECGVKPSNVNYVEAHGTGTTVGDPEELNAIDAMFTMGRTKPLLIGSVKSNLGHAEGASGICSIAKTIIAMETGIIPPNINLETPRKSLKAIMEGRVKVVTDPTPWEGGYAAINSFGFGGANVHKLLKSNPKDKLNNGVPNDNLPRLVAVSGRTEDAVATLLKDLESKPVDAEYVKLLHDLHSEELKDHLFRGYTILPSHGVVQIPVRNIQAFSGKNKPICFAFSGMGSQWPEMGKALLQLPTFLKSIRRCDTVLKPLGVDIFDIITNKDTSTFDNILNSFVGIAAIQIGLVDILSSIGIKPDLIIGHSAGELGCAYADGCFTAEQMILVAYMRGKASIETKTIYGSMAAVGIGYKKLKNLCPADIEIACHNSSESATISGPAASIKTFANDLKAKNIFVREVSTSNIAYHSRYIAPVGPKLLAYLQKMIPDPKQRSKKWLSTSVPIDKWESSEARLSSAEYHTNNLLNSVLFEETIVLLPKNAITIEIAPHGLLQAILRRSLSPEVTNIALTQRNNENNLQILLEAIGKMFTAGLHPQIANLYPPIEYPVSRGTAMISPLIKWQHSEDYFVSSFKVAPKDIPTEKDLSVSLNDEDFKYMSGHMIENKNLFPATGYLLLVWKLFATTEGSKFTELPVVFEQIKFLKATTFVKNKSTRFRISIQKGSGKFEINENESAVVTGFIRICTNFKSEVRGIKPDLKINEEEVMTTDDVYKELKLRGYKYSGLFRSIKSATVRGSKGHVTWHNEWCTFLDNMLQMIILTKDTRRLFIPIAIKKLIIDPKYHTNLINTDEETFDFPVYYNEMFNLIISGGVEIEDVQVNSISRRKPTVDPVLEEYKFIPFIDDDNYRLCDVIRICLHICLENIPATKIKTVEFIEETDEIQLEELVSPWILECCNDLPLIQPDINIVCKKNYFKEDSLPSSITIADFKTINIDTNAILVIGYRLLTTNQINNFNLLVSGLRRGGFLLSRENTEELENVTDKKIIENNGLNIVLIKKFNKETFILLKKEEIIPEKIKIIRINNMSFNWVDTMRTTLKEETEKQIEKSTRIIFLGQGDFDNGLLGFINCLRLEPGGEIVRGILIQDHEAPEFSLNNSLYSQQIKKDLAISVLGTSGLWGSYRHLPLPPSEVMSVEHVLASQLTHGDLSSLTWVEGPLKFDNQNHVLNIIYAGINFRDVMIASGRIPTDIFIRDRKNLDFALGLEFSGTNTLGDRKMGIIACQGLSNRINYDPDLLFDVPDNMSLEEAATIPCVYGTCYFALYIKGNMKPGDKVLIHAGSGGIGQAAINLCLYEGCEVFTTVGTQEKRGFIRKNFPQIKDDHIGNSRDTSFKLMIMEQTNGKGVDIVLNSLSEEKLQASIECLAIGGRFLEIGKYDMMKDNPLGMQYFMREISFQAILLDAIFSKPREEKLKLKELIENGMKIGAIKPLVRTVFPRDQLQSAFRYMTTGKHIGKILIKMQEEKKVSNDIMALPRFYSLKDHCYIVLGGLGGFGLELVDWIILRGAKNIVIVSRTGMKTGYQKSRIDLWQQYNVKIEIITGKDISQEKDCQYIIEIALRLGPVDGIFNLAVVLKDALWENQTPESFKESFHPKAYATKHMDILSRKMCPNLRYFVVFSSITCGKGNAGQTNYGMSNSVMERICERRVSEGLPGLAIQWGAIGDVGLVAEMQHNHKEMIIGGTLQQNITSCFQVLDQFLQQKRPIVSSMVVAEKRINIAKEYSVVDAVLDIMALKDLKGINVYAPLSELGMDSMMGVEIKQTLERDFDIHLTAKDIRSLNFAKLQKFSTEQSTKKVNKNVSTVTELESINLIFRLVGNEDLILETCLKMPSQDEPDREPVFLIPGIVGVASIFSTLIQNLKSSVVCLQPGIIDNSYTSIFEMANQLFPHVVKRIKDKRKFVIVGYSFGATIAIELVRKLEAEGYSGRFILIDGAPVYLKMLVDQMMGFDVDVSILQNKILMYILFNYTAKTDFMNEITEELQKCNNWMEKLEIYIKYVPGYIQNTLSYENQKVLITAIYRRIEALREYSTSHLQPINTPITLLKPTMQVVRLDNDDYDLSKVTKGQIEVYIVQGNHLTILDDKKVTKAINGDRVEDLA